MKKLIFILIFLYYTAFTMDQQPKDESRASQIASTRTAKEYFKEGFEIGLALYFLMGFMEKWPMNVLYNADHFLQKKYFRSPDMAAEFKVINLWRNYVIWGGGFYD